MKRSEMILRLQDQLEYLNQNGKFSTDPYMYYGHNAKLAEEVLGFLEELGMQPPLSEVKLVPDPTRKGTMMHTEAKREWDEE